MFEDDEVLETPKQLACRVGLKERQIRKIRTEKIEHVAIGCRVYIPKSAWGRFIRQANSVAKCLDETKDHGCDGLPSAKPSTSVGQKAVAAASARLARQTASKLKRSSPNGSKCDGTSDGRAIPPKCS
jgi:hypothetical protein